MSELESLQIEFDNAKKNLMEIESKIVDKGFILYDNKVLKKETHNFVVIESAYYGEYHSDYELYISTRQFPISEENKDFFIERLNNINSFDSLKSVNDSYYLVVEDYFYLNEQPLSLFYKKSDTEFELSGINVSSTNAKFRQLKYCNIQFLTQEKPVKKINKEIKVEDGEDNVYPQFYEHKNNINILCNFKVKKD